MKQPKIAVIGIGGVGGYLAGALARTYDNVTFVARGERKKAIEEHGLVVHSETLGEFTAHPAKVTEDLKEAGEQDYIFVCVKNYSLEEICGSIRDVVTDGTVIVPVMNGVDPGDRVREFLGRGIVLDSLIYIVSYADMDYSIVQKGGKPCIFVGCKNGDVRETEAALRTADLIKAAKVYCKAREDIETAIWEKYAFNCAYNVLTAYFMSGAGAIREDAERLAEFEETLREAMAVAEAKGVRLPEDYFEREMRRFKEVINPDAGSSLMRDIADGRRTELETFSGYLVREAKRLGVSVPLSEKYYEELKERI